MEINFRFCLPKTFDDSFDYISGILNRLSFFPVNPYTGRGQAIDAQGENVDPAPEKVDLMARAQEIRFLVYWDHQKSNLSLGWTPRGAWWEFVLTDPAAGRRPGWRGNAKFLLIVQQIVSDAVLTFGENIDDEPIISLFFD